MFGKLALATTLSLLVLVVTTSVEGVEPQVNITGDCTFAQSGPGVYSISSGVGGYVDLSLCSWAFEGALITIDLEWMGTESGYDYLDMWRSDIPGVVDHDSVCGGPYTGYSGTYCVRFTGGGEASWTGARLTACQATNLYFYSDGSITDGGFLATVTVNNASACTGLYNGTAGDLVSQTYTPYYVSSSNSGDSGPPIGIILVAVLVPFFGFFLCFFLLAILIQHQAKRTPPNHLPAPLPRERTVTNTSRAGVRIVKTSVPPSTQERQGRASGQAGRSGPPASSSTESASVSRSHDHSSDDDGERPVLTAGKQGPPPPSYDNSVTAKRLYV